jgi:perosamine synthetase
LERLEELVEFRKAVARLFLDAAAGCKWLIPQYVPDYVVHSYWTTVFKLDESVPFSWYDFRSKYRELGGDGVYACWQLTHLEPVFRGKQISEYQWQTFEKGLMPVAESLQPRLFQFKTNYWDMDVAEKQADLLAQTIRHFGG